MVRSDPLLGHCVCEQINIYPAVNFLCSSVCERERQRNLVTNLSTGVLTALFVFADKLIGKFSFFIYLLLRWLIMLMMIVLDR